MLTDNWQFLIVTICVAAAVWWLGRRAIRFVHALRHPETTAACGGCDQCPSSSQAQTESGMPIVDLRVGDKRPNR